ncbi:acetyltransferase (GNAT) family protein [Streptomyces sp. TLI_235]|nr:GNAT family N-acetyltransferase [Streptomyces sp. TLI_235]PBC67647.1 acetyltransferase (GNAT) family protein [Streptomyces sp. TLI_235]
MPFEYRPVPARVAKPADVDAVVGILTAAFFDDPVWGPIFPDRTRRAEQAAAMWRLYVTSALRYPWMFLTEGLEAMALWIPPGGTELTDAETAGLGDFLTEVAGPQVSADIVRICDQLEEAHPDEPHFYLTLLATHPDHRGRGLGMGLVATVLNQVDALGAPAYLESTNPTNLPRYERAGFVPRERITTDAGPVVATMWRPAR